MDELPSLDELKDEIQHYSALEEGGILAGSCITLVTCNFDVGSQLIPDCCDSMLPLAMLCMNCSSKSSAKLIIIQLVTSFFFLFLFCEQKYQTLFVLKKNEKG